MNNILPNKPFTISDIQYKNPKISPLILYQNLNNALKLGIVKFLGILNLPNRRTQYVYSKSPITNKIVDIAKEMGVRRVIKKKVLQQKSYSRGNLTDSQQKFIDDIFTHETIREIMVEVRRTIKSMMIKAGKHVDGFRTALKSDMFSSLVGSITKDIITKEHGVSVIISGNDDNKPDIYFPKVDISLEIKATTGNTWQGGHLSNRPYPTLLVRRNHENDAFWVGLVPLVNWDDSNMLEGKRRYATKATWTWVRDNPYLKVILGRILKFDKHGNSIKGNIELEEI